MLTRPSCNPLMGLVSWLINVGMGRTFGGIRHISLSRTCKCGFLLCGFLCLFFIATYQLLKFSC